MIEAVALNKTYPGGIHAVTNACFAVSKGETLILIGLSGCGKTTLLRMINRLVEPDSGEIIIDGTRSHIWNPIELRRKIGYVIQDVGLLPHLTIGENVGIVPRLKAWGKEKIEESVRTMLGMVNLDPDTFSDRYPHELSGGQKQRAGVARALAGNPDIVLMDEPFGALDPVTREELQDEFLKLQNVLKKTILFVTHDIFEAVKMGSRIAVMKDGAIEQTGSPREILNNPANGFVERFIGRHRTYLATCVAEREA
jgi:osmoprotectant transport system ATP-binding protein